MYYKKSSAVIASLDRCWRRFAKERQCENDLDLDCDLDIDFVQQVEIEIAIQIEVVKKSAIVMFVFYSS